MSAYILIIDDSELALAVTADILTEAGYKVSTALNCIDANSFIFGKEKPELIIMDVMMPMLPGDKTAQLLKDNVFTKDIKLIYISSKSSKELEKIVETTGAAGFLCKPYSEEALLEKVKSVLMHS